LPAQRGQSGQAGAQQFGGSVQVPLAAVTGQVAADHGATLGVRSGGEGAEHHGTELAEDIARCQRPAVRRSTVRTSAANNLMNDSLRIAMKVRHPKMVNTLDISNKILIIKPTIDNYEQNIQL
jgi:hypothetical protein